MMLQWLISLLVLPALLGAGVALGEPWFRSRGVPTRFLWASAMLVSLAWSTLAALSPRVADAVSETVAYLPPIVVDATGALTVAATPIRQSVDRTAPILLGLVVGCALIGIARLGVGLLQLRAERATWQRRTMNGYDVLVSRDRGPAVVGITDPQIVLPEWIASADGATREIVLRHENEHRAANDVATLFGARVLVAIVPWSPGFRWMASRLALAIEHDCDIRVLRSGVGRPDYESALLAVADRIGTPRLAPSLSESASYLERRITAMRTLNRRRSALAPVAGSGIALVAMYAVFSFPGAAAAVAQVTPSMASANGRPATVASVPAAPTVSAAPSVSAPSVGATPSVPAAPSVSARATAAPRQRGSRASAAAVVPDTVYFEYQVDQPVGIDSMAAPRYPAEQRMANVEGEVLAQFVVDTTGRMEPASLKVLRTNHEDFTAAVRVALEAARFKPAMKGGQKVRQVVQMPFVFRLSR